MTEKHAGYVLYQEEMGVYVGSCMGFGFWSKFDPAGQDCAPIFDTVEEIQEYVATLETPINDWRAVPVQINDRRYATIAECVEAGLPAWAV